MAKDDEQDLVEGIRHIRKEPRPDFSQPLPPAKLPKSIEETLNDDEKLWSAMYEGRYLTRHVPTYTFPALDQLKLISFVEPRIPPHQYVLRFTPNTLLRLNRPELIPPD